MAVKPITEEELRRFPGEGLIIRGCGGPLSEWVDGINELLSEDGILLGGAKFPDCRAFEHEGLTCLLFPFSEGVAVDFQKLAIWRLRTRDAFCGTWLSDFVDNELGGRVFEPQQRQKKPDCPLIGQDGNIFNLAGIAEKCQIRRMKC